MFSYSSTSPARCLAASWLGLAVLSLTIDGLGAGGGTCKFNLDEYQERRVKAIKGQILSKLGLTAPPTDDGPEVIPKEVMDLFNRTATLLEQKFRKEKAHCSLAASDDYFAQVPLQYNITQKSHHKSAYELERKKKSEFFKFELSAFESESGGVEVSEAEFYLYQVPNDRMTIEQKIDLFQLMPPADNSTRDPTRRYLTSWTRSSTSEGWISYDVSDVVRYWLRYPETNLGFEVNLNCGDLLPEPTTASLANDPDHTLHILFGDPRGTYPTVTNGRGDENPMPFYKDKSLYPSLIVIAPANHSRGNDVSRRRRSTTSYTNAVCDRDSPHCCLRPLVINFKRDLRWKWIRHPKEYSPNFCAGQCPYILSQETNVASVLSLYKHLNPDASPSPCCSPRSFKPLTIVFYNKGRPEIRKLNNMIIESCRCS